MVLFDIFYKGNRIKKLKGKYYMKNLYKESIKTKLKRFLKAKKNIDLCYIFGSILKREKFNDIDIAILFNKKISRDESERLRLKMIGEIIDLLHFDNIDLVVLNYLDDPLLAYQIVSSGEVLIKRKPFIDTRFKTKTMGLYLDFKHFLDQQFNFLMKDYGG